MIDFKRDPWPKVSDNAKDLVKKMLDPDPTRRLTAHQVLGNVCGILRYCTLFIRCFTLSLSLSLSLSISDKYFFPGL